MTIKNWDRIFSDEVKMNAYILFYDMVKYDPLPWFLPDLCSVIAKSEGFKTVSNFWLTKRFQTNSVSRVVALQNISFNKKSSNVLQALGVKESNTKDIHLLMFLEKFIYHMSNDKNVCCDSSKGFLTIVNVHITCGHSWTPTLVENRVPVIHVESLTINGILHGNMENTLSSECKNPLSFKIL